MLAKLKAKIARRLGVGCPTADELRKKGVTLGQRVAIHTRGIDEGHGFLISMGDDVSIAPGAIILAHDASTKQALGYTRVGRVEIGSQVFIGAGAIVLPNVRIGNKVIVGAGCVVNRSVPDNSVVVGNPARVISSYDDYIEKNRQLMDHSPIYHTYWPSKTAEEKAQMRHELPVGQTGFDV